MLIFTQVIYRGILRGMKRKDRNAAQREAWGKAGLLWHSAFREKHYTAAGAREYRYKARTPNYVRRKRKTRGHNDPLVWTGQTRTLSRIRNIRPTATGVKIRLHTPALNYMPKGGRINLREESTRVSAPEKRAIAAEFKQTLVSKIKQNRGVKRVRIATRRAA